MGKKDRTFLVCDVCDSERDFDHYLEHLPYGWDKSYIMAGNYKSADFLICPECRSEIYREGMFGKIFNIIFLKKKKSEDEILDKQ